MLNWIKVNPGTATSIAIAGLGLLITAYFKIIEFFGKVEIVVSRPYVVIENDKITDITYITRNQFDVTVRNKSNKIMKISDLKLLNFEKGITTYSIINNHKIDPFDSITFKFNADGFLEKFGFDNIIIEMINSLGHKYYSCNKIIKFLRTSAIKAKIRKQNLDI